MSSYDEKLLALETRRKELITQELALAAARERLAVEQQLLDVEKLVDMHGLTDTQIADFRAAVKCVVKIITAEEVTHAGLAIVDEPSTDPDDKPFSIVMSCEYSTHDIPGMTYTVTIKTQNPVIVAILRSMIKQVSHCLYDEPCDESKRTTWRVYWDDYETIKLND